MNSGVKPCVRGRALVTGAARGIGLSVAEALARAGYMVFACYRSGAQGLPELAKRLSGEGYTLLPVQADVTDPASVTNLFSQAGSVDILVNNAGVSQYKEFLDITAEDWRYVLEGNLTSAFLCAQAALPGMMRKGGGSIVNISSIWGVTGGACEAHYSAAKAGLIGLTKALAKEFGPSGIRVNCVAPGVIETRMTEHLSGEDIARLSDETPLGRIGSPDEVARAVVAIAENGFITGEVLNVNGGLYMVSCKMN